MAAKFQLGQIVITPGALAAIPNTEVIAAIRRHVFGDWGNLCAEDAQQNEWALRNEARLLSSYESLNGTRFWIITEADRSATTVLLPEEY